MDSLTTWLIIAVSHFFGEIMLLCSPGNTTQFLGDACQSNVGEEVETFKRQGEASIPYKNLVKQAM